MQVRILRLRQSGIVAHVPKTRDCSEHEAAKVNGLLDMPRGKHLALRALTASPGSQPLIELFAPTLVAWDQSTVRVRGFEQSMIGDKAAGVLQEWIIWPLR